MPVHPTSPVSRILLDHKTGSGNTLCMSGMLENYYFTFFERGVSEREGGREGEESGETQDDSSGSVRKLPKESRDFRKTARD